MINHLNHKNYNNIIEYNGINILNNILNKYYITKRTPEGCNSDIVIKRIDEEKDIWIPIQIKTTNNSNYDKYSFDLMNKSNKYKNIILICICVSEKKIWVIPINIIDAKVKLNISINKSKYNEYLIDDNNTYDKGDNDY
jgi:hypothetical protein